MADVIMMTTFGCAGLALVQWLSLVLLAGERESFARCRSKR